MCEGYLKCDTTDAEVIEMMKTKIANEEGFSFVRFGDGEFPVIQEPLLKPAKRLDPTMLDGITKRQCKNWGYQYPEECEQLQKDFLKIFRFAVQHSDMVGLVDFNNKANTAFHLKNPKKRILRKMASLAQETASALGYQQGKQQICDHCIVRRRALGNIKGFKNILQGRPVHIISVYVKELKENKIAELLGAEVTYTQLCHAETLRHLQNRLHKFCSIKEKVVLFGAGSGGKNIGAFLKMENGATCIDMGCILAAWGGLDVRPYMRGKGRHVHLVVNRRNKKKR